MQAHLAPAWCRICLGLLVAVVGSLSGSTGKAAERADETNGLLRGIAQAEPGFSTKEEFSLSQPANLQPEKVVSSAANDQLLYFTSTSLLADDRHVFFLSDRTGQPNIFLRDLKIGQDRQLTFNTEGFLKSYVYGVKPDGSGRVEIALPKEWDRYGHFTVGRPGWLVTDGCFVEPRDPKRFGGAWISVLRVDWEAKRYNWQPLCRHGSSWSSQDAHPHPIFNHAGDAVYFTSDKSGKRAVCRVPGLAATFSAQTEPVAMGENKDSRTSFGLLTSADGERWDLLPESK